MRVEKSIERIDANIIILKKQIESLQMNIAEMKWNK